MRVLRRILPTPEQINIVRRIQQGVSLIRGAAGSGKTSTALTALRAATGTAVNQLRNEGNLPANVLVLTYYNTLKGYISAVAEAELADYANDVRLVVTTFDKWAYATLNWRGPLPIEDCERKLRQLASTFPRDMNFILDEVNYLLGRFQSGNLTEYLSKPRAGRGSTPQMDSSTRQKLLDEVVFPYLDWKRVNDKRDFHDLAAAMALDPASTKYDVVVADEAQDLSANQLRAIVRHCSPSATVTIVTDSAQRIYPRGAPWSEAGLTILPNRSFRLTNNYRNTREIAALAASIASGLTLDDDGSLPDPALCTRTGTKPILLKGKFNQQLAYTVDIPKTINIAEETVGFLHLKGGGCFNFLRAGLIQAGYDFCELQGASVWPEHGPNIGLCTLHSAKGLEFDHVFMIGMNQEHASHGSDADDDRYTNLRRLLAMGVGRARKTVVVGTKPQDQLVALTMVDPATVQEVEL